MKISRVKFVVLVLILLSSDVICKGQESFKWQRIKALWSFSPGNQLVCELFSAEELETIYEAWRQNKKIPAHYKYGCEPEADWEWIQTHISPSFQYLFVLDSNSFERFHSREALASEELDSAEFYMLGLSLISNTVEGRRQSSKDPRYCYVVILRCKDNLLITGKDRYSDVKRSFRSNKITPPKEFKRVVRRAFKKGVLSSSNREEWFLD